MNHFEESYFFNEEISTMKNKNTITMCYPMCLSSLNSPAVCSPAPGRSGEQQDVLRWPGVPEAVDGGHEVPPAAWAAADVPEPTHKAQEVHRGGALRRGGHGRLQR